MAFQARVGRGTGPPGITRLEGHLRHARRPDSRLHRGGSRRSLERGLFPDTRTPGGTGAVSGRRTFRGRYSLEPTAHDYLLLGVKADGVFAVGVEVAEEGVFPAGEGEEGHGGGDAYVDADHADFAAGAVLAGALAAGGEDGGRVAEGGRVD